MAEVKVPPSPDYGVEVEQGDQVIEPAVNARQGVTHHNVRYVLAVSLTGVVVLFALIYLLFFWR